MTQITGQDIFSVTEWNTFLSQAPFESSNAIIQEITSAISLYHSIDKKVESNIEKRQVALTDISSLCSKFIEQKGTEDKCILSLQEKCVNKSEYLTRLKDFLIHAKPHHKDREEMIEHLKTRNQSNTHTRLKLFSGTYLEKIDPLHRQFEFDMNKLPKKESGVNRAFIEWVNSNENIPFFLWLENHDVITANQEKINLIAYYLPDAHVVTIDKNTLVSKSRDSIEETSKLLNTPTLKNQSLKMGTVFGSAAFVWCKNNENQFITHPHKEGTNHHSSLVAGKSVRCAGTWLVKNGIVTHISNQSGHYKPSSLSFYLLIKFLQNKGVVQETTRVADWHRPEEPADKSKPLGAVKNRYIKLTEYLKWAEEKPEVKDYVRTSNSHIQQACRLS